MSNKIFYPILAIISVLYLLSCASASKLTYRALDKDSIAVIKIVRAIAPCITTDSTTTQTLIPAKDSTAFFRSQADSLRRVKQHIKDSIAIRYKDSCRSVMDNYDAGFNLGYEVGKYEGLQECTPDTLQITTRYNIKDMGEVDICNALKDAAEKNNNTLRKWRNVFAIAAAIGWILLLLVLLIKKR